MFQLKIYYNKGYAVINKQLRQLISLVSVKESLIVNKMIYFISETIVEGFRVFNFLYLIPYIELKIEMKGVPFKIHQSTI